MAFFTTFHLQYKLEGHTAEIYDIAFKESKNLLLTTSDDQTAKLYTLQL